MRKPHWVGEVGCRFYRGLKAVKSRSGLGTWFKILSGAPVY